jgi:hypothetical protein
MLSLPFSGELQIAKASLRHLIPESDVSLLVDEIDAVTKVVQQSFIEI